MSEKNKYKLAFVLLLLAIVLGLLVSCGANPVIKDSLSTEKTEPVDVRSLRSKVKSLEKENHLLRVEIDHLKAKNAELKRELAMLKGVKDLKRDLKKLKKTIECN